MRQTKIVIIKPITSDRLSKFMTIEAQISKALDLLGYDLDKHELELKHIAYDLYKVSMDGRYFGIWDSYRCTFVD